MLGNNSDGIENRNGTASALLHIDESAGLGRLAKQKPKKRRRPDSRQYQTGEGVRVPRCSVLRKLSGNASVHPQGYRDGILVARLHVAFLY